MKTYYDKFVCPKCGQDRAICRRTSSAGKTVKSFCSSCRKSHEVIAGAAK